MEAADRETFERLLAELFGALDKPLTEAKREGFWKGLASMSLVEFARCRDQLLTELQESNAPKSFGVSDVWAAKRRLRAAPIEPTVDDWRGDDWNIRANKALLKFIAHALSQNSPVFGPVRPYTFKKGELCWSPEQAEATAVLVAYKKAWAQDMREWDGVPTVEEQVKAWDGCMTRAMSAIIEAKKAA